MELVLSCSLVCLQGSPGPSGAVGPIGAAGVRVGTDRPGLMATTLSEFFKHEPDHFRPFSLDLVFSGPSRKGRIGRTQRPHGAHGKSFNWFVGSFDTRTPGSCCWPVSPACKPS